VVNSVDAQHDSRVRDLLHRAGRLEEAVTLLKQALHGKEEALGPERTSTTTASNLGLAYREQHHWEEAEVLEFDMIEKTTKVLGSEDPSTLRCIDDLASVYVNQGRLKEAGDLVLGIVERVERSLGPENPARDEGRAALSAIHARQRQLEEA